MESASKIIPAMHWFHIEERQTLECMVFVILQRRHKCHGCTRFYSIWAALAPKKEGRPYLVVLEWLTVNSSSAALKNQMANSILDILINWEYYNHSQTGNSQELPGTPRHSKDIQKLPASRSCQVYLGLFFLFQQLWEWNPAKWQIPRVVQRQCAKIEKRKGEKVVVCINLNWVFARRMLFI